MAGRKPTSKPHPIQRTGPAPGRVQPGVKRIGGKAGGRRSRWRRDPAARLPRDDRNAPSTAPAGERNLRL